MNRFIFLDYILKLIHFGLDYTIVAAEVTKVSGTAKTGTAGETVTAGQAVYLKSSDGRLWKAKANGATADEKVCVGIALHGSLAGQPLDYLDEPGSVLTMGTAAITGAIAGDAVILSGAVAGNLAPHADAVAGWMENVIGFWDTTAKKIKLSITRADVVRG